jgi:hypothetical protein
VAASDPAQAEAPKAEGPPSIPGPVATSQQTAAAKKQGGSALPIVGGILLLAGIAATAVVMSRQKSPPPPPVATAETTTAATTAPPAPTAAPALSVAKSEPGVMDINALSEAASASASVVARVPGPMPKVGDKPDTSAAAPAEVAPPPTASAVAAAPMGSVGELKDEMAKRVGHQDGTEGGEGQAAGPAAKQDKPSMGQVQGALGSVRPAAQRCLEGSGSVTRVGIVFGSDGSVKSVSISGGAAGKPAEACVRAAIMKAKVPPFTAPSYSTSLNIRP